MGNVRVAQSFVTVGLAGGGGWVSRKDNENHYWTNRGLLPVVNLVCDGLSDRIAALHTRRKSRRFLFSLLRPT